MELGRTSFRVYPWSYTRYHRERAEDLERERRARRRASRVRRARPRTSSARTSPGRRPSRRRAGARCSTSSSASSARRTCGRAPSASASASPRRPRSGDIVLEAKGLGAERGGAALFSRRRPAGAPRRSHRHRRPERLRASRRCSSCSPGAATPTDRGRGAPRHEPARGLLRSAPRLARPDAHRRRRDPQRARRPERRRRAPVPRALPLLRRRPAAPRVAASRAASARASRWPSCCSSRATCCSSTSRPTTSTSPPRRSWKRRWSASRAR